jgi:hypothetical protein
VLKLNLPAILFVISITTLSYSQTVSTTLNDFFMPGSQPNESGSFNSMPNNCGCHASYDQNVEPMYTWQGTIMSQAARDPLYLAALTIANQDADFSGDLCIRCHAPRGWLGSRSTPTNGSALTSDDREGIYCDYCHRAVKPTEIGVNPYPTDPDYTSSTYSADQTYLTAISAHIPETSGNGMYIIDSDDTRRGPYTESDAQATHIERYSPFHSDAYFCGTCHDVSNPAFTLQPNGTYTLNNLNEPSPDFDPYTMFPVERTFSEWKMSEYNTTQGVYAPQFGGNKDYVSTCQDCHLKDVTGKGCDKQNAPVRNDLPLHDMTGGNTFIPPLVASLYPSEVNEAALLSGITRATYMLQNAATLEYQEPVIQSDDILLRVKVTNETGHKLPSGYPEGRRIWVNVKAYSDEAKQNLVFESGAYDTSAGILTHDAQVKIYEIKPGNDTEPSFHFVLNNKIHKDNRIPPRGFTNANFEAIQSPPVAYTYADGQYWDLTDYLLPLETKYFDINLYYQTVSKEYIEFLDSNNTTNNAGDILHNLWSAYGKSAPVLMGTTGNEIPLPVELVSFTANVTNTFIHLSWVTITEVNNYGFDIERISFGEQNSEWIKIGFVEGNGNSNSTKHYTFVDKEPKVGYLFGYRLKQIDTDGTYTYSDIIEVEMIPYEFALHQNYPNPFNPVTKISWQSPEDVNQTIIIFDILGNEVVTLVDEYKPAGRYEIEFNAEQLPSGVYFYRLQAGNFIKIKKMVLMK